MTANRVLLLTSAIVSLAALSACYEDTPKSEKIDRLAWSEDGSEIAYVVSRYEESGSQTAPSSTFYFHNFSHQVYIQPADGSPARKLGNEQALQNLEDFYYFKQAGYLIVSYRHKPITGPEFKRYYQLLMDGKSHTLNLQSETQVVPSPDGQTIAIMQHSPYCQPAAVSAAGTQVCSAEVDFLKASDRQPIGEKRNITFSSRQVPELTWTPAGALVASTNSESFSLQPTSSETQTVTRPRCMSPKTSSGPVNAQGELAYAEGMSVKRRSEPALPRFGCQG